MHFSRSNYDAFFSRMSVYSLNTLFWDGVLLAFLPSVTACKSNTDFWTIWKRRSIGIVLIVSRSSPSVKCLSESSFEFSRLLSIAFLLLRLYVMSSCSRDSSGYLVLLDRVAKPHCCSWRNTLGNVFLGSVVLTASWHCLKSIFVSHLLVLWMIILF